MFTKDELVTMSDLIVRIGDEEHKGLHWKMNKMIKDIESLEAYNCMRGISVPVDMKRDED